MFTLVLEQNLVGITSMKLLCKQTQPLYIGKLVYSKYKCGDKMLAILFGLVGLFGRWHWHSCEECLPY